MCPTGHVANALAVHVALAPPRWECLWPQTQPRQKPKSPPLTTQRPPPPLPIPPLAVLMEVVVVRMYLKVEKTTSRSSSAAFVLGSRRCSSRRSEALALRPPIRSACSREMKRFHGSGQWIRSTAFA